jgi:hypothetical protein
VSANRVVASSRMEGGVVVSAAGDRRFVIEGILTCVRARHILVVHSHEKRGRKERE